MLLDFWTLRRPLWPNHCLAAPEAWALKGARVASPVLAYPVEILRDAVLALATKEARTKLLRLEERGSQAEFQQRSRLFRFPDLITVEFVALPEGCSALAVYSRARYGVFDFGVNKRRVRRWLAALESGAGLKAPDE